MRHLSAVGRLLDSSTLPADTAVHSCAGRSTAVLLTWVTAVQALEMDELQQDAAAAARVTEEAAELRAVEVGLGSKPAASGRLDLSGMLDDLPDVMSTPQPTHVEDAQAAAQLRLAEAGREVDVLRAKLAAASSAAAANGKTLVEQRQELKQASNVHRMSCAEHSMPPCFEQTRPAST